MDSVVDEVISDLSDKQNIKFSHVRQVGWR